MSVFYLTSDSNYKEVHMSRNICKTCGKITEKKSQLCDPVKLDKVVVCDTCGRTSDNPEHLCKPEKKNINFTCITCGRVAELPNDLCNPRDIVLMQRKDPPTRIF